MDVHTPLRADHRFIKKVTAIVLGGKVESRSSEFTMLSEAFRQLGGSWERVFKGSPQDIHLLKRIIKRAYKRDLLTKKEPWKANG